MKFYRFDLHNYKFSFSQNTLIVLVNLIHIGMMNNVIYMKVRDSNLIDLKKKKTLQLNCF